MIFTGCVLHGSPYRVRDHLWLKDRRRRRTLAIELVARPIELGVFTAGNCTIVSMILLSS